MKKKKKSKELHVGSGQAPISGPPLYGSAHTLTGVSLLPTLPPAVWRGSAALCWRAKVTCTSQRLNAIAAGTPQHESIREVHVTFALQDENTLLILA